MKQRQIGIVLNYINLFLNLAFGLIYIPLLLHYIGKQEYGLYQLLGSIIAYFSIMDFGLGAAIGRFYKQYHVCGDKKGCENILAIAVRAFVGIDFLVVFIGGVLLFNLDSLLTTNITLQELALAKILFTVLLFNVLISLPYIPFRAVINAHEQFLFAKGLATLQLLIQPLLVWLLLCQYPSALSVVAVHTFLNLLTILAGLYFCFYRLRIVIKYYCFDKEIMLSFGSMSFYTFAVTVIDQLFFRTNQIVLGIINGVEAVAVYAVAAYVYMHYATLSQAIVGVYFPYVNELVAHKVPPESLSDFFIKIGRRQFFILALVSSGFVVFGEQFLEIWVGKGFEDAYYISLLVIIPFTIDLIQNAGILIMQAKNKYGFRAAVYFVTGIFHLLASIYLGKQWGGIGCATATCLALILSNGVVMNWHYYKVHGLNIPLFWQEIGRCLGGILVLAIPAYCFQHVFYYESRLFFLVKIVIYSLLYCVLCYNYLLNSEEKEDIQRLPIARRFLCPKPRIKDYSGLYQILLLPKNRSNLALYVEQLLTLPTHYVWGALGQYMDVFLIDHVLKYYPGHYNAKEINNLKNYYGTKTLAFDCSGLVKSYYMGGLGAPTYKAEWDLNCEGLYKSALRKGEIASLPEEVGLCLYMEGHMGIYLGKGRVIECTPNAEFGNGVVETKLTDRNWQNWFSCPFIEDN